MQSSTNDKATQYKNEGNEYFKKKEYEKAIESYTNAISKLILSFFLLLGLNPMDPSYYGNRAACWLGLKK
jgi:tetratricopeptide (TPR) repeat protein